MRTQHFTTLAMIALLATVTASNAAENGTFRGIQKDQGDNVIDSTNGSHAMGERPWFIDIEDRFENRSGPLDGSDADTHQKGFVPPIDTRDSSSGAVPQGPLPEALADEHGNWVGDGSYLVDGGQVQRTNMNNPNGVATLPWRVVPELGDDYLGEANVTVAVGESVAIAFTGDAANTSGVMDGEYGQLALQVSRSNASDPTEVSWQVKWDTADETPGYGTASGDPIAVPVTGEIRLQLAWNEVMNTFDAWMDDTQLAFDTLDQGGISVHGYSIYLGGTGSTINSSLNAVPEPSSLVLLTVGLIGLFGFRNRNRR